MSEEPGVAEPPKTQTTGSDPSAWRRYSCADPGERHEGIEAAVASVHRGELIVLPTDTVYGIGADAFEPDAVADLLAAKGRGRQMPPPVLVGAVGALAGVAAEVPDAGRHLVEAFWPGALTLICREQPSLMWDLGDNDGTVAVRMPDNEVALDLLRQTGPLAVSSANRSGQPPSTSVEEAYDQLGDTVAVYLDGGVSGGAEPSTIVDLTRAVPCLLRAGVLSLEQLRAVVPELVDVNDLPDPDEESEPADSTEPAGEAVASEKSADRSEVTDQVDSERRESAGQ